jgi:multiple sugar transport system substrate-binding protein
LLTASLTLASAESSTQYKEPDYSKFKVEDGQITLEFWSWVGGLDNTVKDFEKAYPNIKIHVNNVGGGPAEYEKLQTALKAGSGAPDVAQIEYDFLPSFIVTDGLADIAQYGANDAKPYLVPWTWGQVSPDGKAVFGIPQDSGPLALIYGGILHGAWGGPDCFIGRGGMGSRCERSFIDRQDSRRLAGGATTAMEQRRTPSQWKLGRKL